MKASRINRVRHGGVAALLGMICIASVGCQASSGTSSASPRATPSAASLVLPTQGRIAFHMSFGHTGDDSNIFTIEPDGTEMEMLTYVGTGQGHPGDPAWAPSGDQIFYDDARANSDHVFSMDVTGGAVKQLTSGSWFDADPAVSPDGKRVAFDRSGGPHPPGAIFVMNTDGSQITRVTTPPKSARDGDTTPAFSPNGAQLAFVRDGAIYTVGVDGAGLRQVTPASLQASRPQWSPDGSKIVFAASDQAAVGAGQNIHVVNVDGNGLVALTDELNPDGAGNPTWSPNGSMIVFTRFRTEIEPHYIAIVIMHADGSNPTEIWHPTPSTDSFPEALAWGKAP